MANQRRNASILVVLDVEHVEIRASQATSERVNHRSESAEEEIIAGLRQTDLARVELPQSRAAVREVLVEEIALVHRSTANLHLGRIVKPN